MKAKLALAATIAALTPVVGQAQAIPAAIYTDPRADSAHPARTTPLQVPSGGLSISALAYLAAGEGPHPTLVLLHGLPGHEKNGDLAQAVRRAGWNVVVFSYRGAWGNPGRFSFDGVLEDTRSVLAHLREADTAKRLRIDPARLVIAGHSMGGWASALTAAKDPGLAGLVLISAGDIGALSRLPRPRLVALMADSRDGLNAEPEALADELLANGASLRWDNAAAGLAKTPVLVLGNVPAAQSEAGALAALIRREGGQVRDVHVSTDHNWNSARVRLASELIGWLQSLPAR